MDMPAEQGLSVLYVLADQWGRDRAIAKALSVEDPAPLDDLVGDYQQRAMAGAVPVGDTDRRAAVARAMGGEVRRGG